MPFEVTPDIGGAQETPEAFGSYIQFQKDGANLGTPTVSTVNLTTGITATRGTGESANVLTLAATGGAGGGAETLLLSLQGNTQGVFNGTSFNDWIATEQVASADASFVAGEIVFTRTGYYAVEIVGRVATDGGPWSSDLETYYGSEVDNAVGLTKSGHSRWAQGASLFVGPPSVTWTDKYFVNITDTGTQTVVPSLYADKYQDDTDPANMTAVVSVTRIGDALISP